MTRLKTDDINHIETSLQTYNRALVSKTGHTLSQIGARAAGILKKSVAENLTKVGVIPMTCGLGVIPGFAKSVQSILRFMGFDAFVTTASDAGGLAEAVKKGAQVVMLADDYRFVAINLTTSQVSDNGDATGRGYAVALDLMAGGLAGKTVLIVGAGPVGIGAAQKAATLGAKIAVFDLDQSKTEELVEKLKVRYKTDAVAELQLEPALLKHRIIIDACPAPAYIEERHLTPETLIAAPGVPLCVKKEFLGEIYGRLLHDPLEIGVATMIYDVCER